MNKKIFIPIIAVVIIALGWLGYQRLSESGIQRTVISLVPEDAIYIIKTNQLTEAWGEVSRTNIWKHLIDTDGFKFLEETDTLLNKYLLNNKTTKFIFDNRPTLMSAHMTSKNSYDFLYVVDLQNSKSIAKLTNYILKIDQTHRVIKLKYKDAKVFKLINKKDASKVIFISTLDNLFFGSFSYQIIKKVVDEKGQKHWIEKPEFSGIDEHINEDLVQFYFNYKKLPDYVSLYLKNAEKNTNNISKQLNLSGFDISQDNERISMSGYTLTQNMPSYMNALLDVKPGKISAHNIISNQAAIYFSLGFKNYKMFHQSLIEQYTQGDKKKKNAFRNQIKKLENFLKINLDRDLFDWIGNEIALVKLRPKKKEKIEDILMIIETNDIDDAQTGMHIIVEQIRKRSPFKFKSYTYKNFEINYIYQKSFFKIIFGDLFQKIEKPYFSFIENYVVFSNSENSLKKFINDYVMGKTLSHDADFIDFKDQMNDKANVNIYIQMPKLYKMLYKDATNSAKKILDNKKNLFLSFNRIGFQLIAKDDIFKTNIVIDHDEDARKKEDAEELENKIDENIHNQYFEDLQFKVHFSDSLEVENGVYRKYYEGSKVIKIEGQVKNNQPHRIWRTYYSSGNLESVVNYDKGAVNGEIFFYYDEKRNIKRIEASYDNNLLDGIYMEYWKNGAQKAKLSYEDGKLYGKAEYFYPSGKLKTKGKYKKGEKRGKWTFYDENGKVIGKKRYSGLFF